MNRATLLTHSARETEALGRALAAGLEAGSFVGLEGGLGAGKTCLVRGLCEGLGVSVRAVSSPTYALVNTYRGRLPVFHVDLYRIADPDEVEATGVLDEAADGVVLVEWIDRVAELLPATGVHIQIETVDEETRRLTLSCASERGDAAGPGAKASRGVVARARQFSGGE